MHIDLEAIRVENNRTESIQDALAVEAPLEIRVNTEPFTVTMRTPGMDRELTRGILHTEGLLADPTLTPDMKEVPQGERRPAAVAVTVPEDQLTRDFRHERTVLSTSSCGLCGKREFESASTGDCPIRLRQRGPLEPVRVGKYLSEMRKGQHLFDRTGGVHAAAVFDTGGAMIALAEDIGRHNAVDKVVGALLLDGNLGGGETLLVSGRVSYEIVFKAWRAGFPVVLAVSAPSSLAVETAARLGMTLAAFCRGDRLTIYTQPEEKQEPANE